MVFIDILYRIFSPYITFMEMNKDDDDVINCRVACVQTFPPLRRVPMGSGRAFYIYRLRPALYMLYCL